MKTRICLMIERANGTSSKIAIEDGALTDDMLHAAEDLLHTLTTGERSLLNNFYDLCAKAFGTTREDAKERVTAATHGMSKKLFDERMRLT